uniref:Uncharacterized protein n=1 Tax=Candidatus Kentrum sp. TUN TaxID=2126343 RepID=A0A450ZDW2_9GAMM|nr:MAG: hypothetical protein BECKTUN1418D_GA0071000_101311 [Candidatus Kentron sp. TUN]VFK53575.1 MAG: hypothetical protein BECKTUN1418F_GA0071002_102425 [Candidatus Kentron sp. TUN]VFK55035.1 MAG: hypothetical protein BECKTUN1418E_GA0071001_102425 [Candidatus Kentron sp. TUN]
MFYCPSGQQKGHGLQRRKKIGKVCYGHWNMSALRAETERGLALPHAWVLSGFLFFRYVNPNSPFLPIIGLSIVGKYFSGEIYYEP